MIIDLLYHFIVFITVFIISIYYFKKQQQNKMKIEITKITNSQYIVNGKTMILEDDHKWRPQIESLTEAESKAFKQRLNAELFNEKNKDYGNHRKT